MSTLNVDKVDPSTGTALEIGTSGDTITVPSGATFNVAGTMQSGGVTVANTPAFYVNRNAQQTITTGTWTLVEFSTETLDSDTNFDMTTYRFTPTTAGWYYLFASAVWDTATDIETTYIAFNKNGVLVSVGGTNNIYYNGVKNSTLQQADGSSDYFTVSCYQASGGDVAISADNKRNYFSGYKIIGA